MSLGAPWWLVTLPVALPAVVLVARSGRRTVPVRQHRVATALRLVGVVLLVLALTQPVLDRPSDRRSVLFLLDRSASVDATARRAQDAFVAAALGSAERGTVAGVAVFGREMRMDAALAVDRIPQQVRVTIDPTASDLGSALRAAAAVLPTEGSRRIVVLTDSVETVGDARAAARELADLGIAVDVVEQTTGRSEDVLVSAVEVPVTAREGDNVPVEVVVEATVAGPATVTLTAGGETYRQRIDLAVGRTSVRFTVPAERSGGLPLTATVTADRDLVPDNDTAQAIVRVLGPPRVAVVEGAEGDSDDLVRALRAGNVEVDLVPAVPGPDDLLVYDALVLVNLPAPPDTVAADLAAYVGDLGRGLVVVGGDRAFGLGGYQDSGLEDLLPVTSDPDDLVRRQPVAEVLVIDTSGSMADCHCSDTDPTALASDINKTDISRAGAGLAISALQPTDRVGVLAFTTGTRWALPFGPVPPGADVAAALNSLVPEGDTSIAPALREALATLEAADEEIRHIVLFTDGWADDNALLDTAEQIADAGVTLSVLGTGEGTGETLRRMAALGGGRYYPGRDLESVPEVFVEETLRVARPLVAEGSFFPALGAVSQVTAGLSAAPPLAGYVLTRSKPTAQVALEIGPGDPLLASWQRGLGRATVWTSDATVRWSVDWVPWEGFVDFWGRLVRDVLPPGLDTPPEVRVTGGSVEVRFEAEGVPLDSAAVVQVRDPAGTVTAVPMQRVGESEFVASVPAGPAGAYWAAVRVESASGVVAAGSGGAVAGYPDEFAFRSPDPALSADVAGATGGRVNPEPVAVFDPAPARGEAALELWPWLAGLALALFLVDVALRRLVLARGDFQLWREALTPPSREPVQALETPAGPDAPPPSREVHPEEETLGRLLRRKRT